MADTTASAAHDGAQPVCRIVVMASGNGSNFQALIDGVVDQRIPNAAIVRLFYNKAKAYARERAEKAVPTIPTEYFNLVSRGFLPKGETDPQRTRDARAAYDAALAQEVLKHNPDLVVLAGWMHVFSAPFLRPLDAAGVKIINLHPALPGRYDGAHAIERAFNDFKAGKLQNNTTGVMIHYVIEEVDRGQAIMTQEVQCREGETLEQLEGRIHGVEHKLIVEATAKVAAEAVERKSRR